MHALLGLIAVPPKRSSHYIKGVLIGAMSMMGLALVMLLAFLWVCLLTKKERAAKKYKEVKKQVEPEASEIRSLEIQCMPFLCNFLLY